MAVRIVSSITSMIILMLCLLSASGCGGGSSDGGTVSGTDSGGSVSTATSADEAALIAFENQLKDLVDTERVKQGKEALEWDESLRSIARSHSRDMAEKGYFGHVNPDGQGPGDRLNNAGVLYDAVAENIAQNDNSIDPAGQALTDWMSPDKSKSATDLNNILDMSGIGYSRVCIGIWRSSYGSYFITMIIYSPRTIGGTGGNGGGNNGGGGGGSSNPPPAPTTPLPQAPAYSAPAAPQELSTVKGHLGIKPFWPYDVNALGAGGKAMVNLWSGNLMVQHTDLTVPGRGLPVVIQRTYNSQSTRTGVFGKGWSSIIDTHLEFSGSTVTLVDAYGGEFVFTDPEADGGDKIYKAPVGRHSVFTKHADGTYSERKKNNSTYYFNSDGKLTKIRHRNINNYIEFTRNGSGKVTAITEASGRTTQIEYNNGYVNRITDPQNRTVTYEHTFDGDDTRLTSMRDQELFQTSYQYNSDDRLSKVTNPRGNSISFTYDSNTHAAKVLDPLFSVDYRYYKGQTRVSDSYGHLLIYYLNDTGNITQSTDTLGYGTWLTWDNDRNITEMKNARNQTTTMTYDAKGNVLTTANAYFTKTFTYDGSDNLTSVMDGKNLTSTFQYEVSAIYPYGILKKVISPMGKTAEFSYDAFGQPLEVSNARGYATNYTFNDNGYITKVTDALNNESTITYNNIGEAQTSTVPINGTTEYTYSARGLMTQVKTPLNNTTSMEYDGNGNRTKVTNAKGKSTQYSYDEDDRLVTVKDALSKNTLYTYENGRLATTKDPSGFTTSMDYDSNDRVIKRINAITTEFFAYDELGNCTTKRTSHGDIKQTYDDINRLVGITMPGRTISYTYDKNSNRTGATVTDTGTGWLASSFAVTNTYNNDNRLIARTKKLNGNIFEDSSFEYDNNNNVTEIVVKVKKGLPAAGGGAEVTFGFINTFDALDRHKTVANSNGDVYTATYNALGNMTKHEDADRKATSVRTYDKENRITQVINTTPLTAPDPPVITYDYTYDAIGNCATVKKDPQYPYPVVTPLEYQYDDVNRLIYDEASVKDTLPLPMRYVYNDAGDKTEDRMYDAANNLKQKVYYTYNSAHQLIKRQEDTIGATGMALSSGKSGTDSAASKVYAPPDESIINYEYDGSGNMYRKTKGAVTTDNVFNAVNRLTKVTISNSDLPQLNQERYSWDFDNELFFTEKRYTAADVPFFSNTLSGYESGALLYKNVTAGTLTGTATLDGSVKDVETSKLEYYTYLNGLRVGITPLQDTSITKGTGHIPFPTPTPGGPAEVTYSCVYDGQGNVVQVTNPSGSMPFSLFTYTSYGLRSTYDQLAGAPDTGGYKGYDSGPFGFRTGARQYDPEAGRFLSPDPFKGYMTDPASQNPYMYCHGNPVNYSDPSGYSETAYGAEDNIYWKEQTYPIDSITLQKGSSDESVYNSTYNALQQKWQLMYKNKPKGSIIPVECSSWVNQFVSNDNYSRKNKTSITDLISTINSDLSSNGTGITVLDISPYWVQQGGHWAAYLHIEYRIKGQFKATKNHSIWMLTESDAPRCGGWYVIEKQHYAVPEPEIIKK
ncbi:MAG: DUF6531 domain-containing protein [Candidatus Xenobiia bacterium LiM19]